MSNDKVLILFDSEITSELQLAKAIYFNYKVIYSLDKRIKLSPFCLALNTQMLKIPLTFRDQDNPFYFSEITLLSKLSSQVLTLCLSSCFNINKYS